VGKATLRRYLQLLLLYAKMDLATLLRDTGFMLMCVISDLCANISAISGVFLLAWRFGGIGGMSEFEVLFMLAYGNIVMGVITLMGGQNALFPSRIIGRGQWEHMFIMPLSYGMQMSVGIFPFTSSSTLLSGVLMTAVAAANLPALPWWWIPLLIANAAVSVIIVVALSYWASSLAFYAPVQCEEISSAVIYSASHVATFPLSGMPLYIRMPLLTIFPAGLIAWLPTLVILGKTPIITNLYPILFAAFASLAAAYFFRKGFRYYVKTGINRYTAGGHRN
jgi:ABC-2 type transport system permease protein